MGFLAHLIALVIFILVAFGVTVGSLTAFEFTAVGLAFFALGHILPGTFADIRQKV